MANLTRTEIRARYYARHYDRLKIYHRKHAKKRYHRLKSEGKLKPLTSAQVAKMVATTHRWRVKNRVRYRAYCRKYYSKLKAQGKIVFTPERKKYLEAWRKANRDKVYIYNCTSLKNRRHRIESTMKACHRLAIRKIYARCAYLKQWFSELEVDHIIPISKGGTHSPDNLQIIYAFENRRKWASSNYVPKVIFQ